MARGLLLALLLLAWAMPAADAQGGPCEARIQIQDEEPRDRTLKPGSGPYRANLTYRDPLALDQCASESCPSQPNAASPAKFRMDSSPPYATYSFLPADAPTASDGQGGYVAKSRLEVWTNESAPPNTVGEYVVRVTGCGLGTATATIKITNAPTPMRPSSVESGEIEMSVRESPSGSAGRFEGSARVPSPGILIALLAVFLGARLTLPR